MDVIVLQQLLSQAHLKGAFQAFLATASSRGATVMELANQLDVSKRTMYRYLAKARIAAERSRNRDVQVLDRPAGYGGPCGHSDAFFLGRKRVCLRCLRSNMEDELKRQKAAADREDRELNRAPAKFKPKARKKAKV